MALDYYLFSLINQYAGQNFYIDKTFVFFSEYLIALFLLFFIIEFRNVKAVFNAIISSVGVVLINSAVSFIYFRPRPFAAYEVNQLVNHVASSSFPSDHAAVSFAFATAVFLYNRKVGVFAYAVAFLISISSIFAGLHYPSDILAGASIGILVSLIINIFIKKYMEKIENIFSYILSKIPI